MPRPNILKWSQCNLYKALQLENEVSTTKSVSPLLFIHMQYVFDYKEGDVFACMSDLGWLSGHTSVVYGPLCNGATTVLFEGTATYPNEGLC